MSTVEEQIRDAIQEAISENEVILFMKGTPEAPRCGFSARTVAALEALGTQFAAVDILPDPRIRQQLSALSNWPTIPQLFVHGELVGGCDIVTEMYETGELAERARRGPARRRARERAPGRRGGRRAAHGREPALLAARARKWKVWRFVGVRLTRPPHLLPGQPSRPHPCALATAATCSQSGSSAGDAGGSVRLGAGTLMSRTRSSKPPGVRMKSRRHPSGRPCSGAGCRAGRTRSRRRGPRSWRRRPRSVTSPSRIQNALVLAVVDVQRRLGARRLGDLDDRSAARRSARPSP